MSLPRLVGSNVVAHPVFEIQRPFVLAHRGGAGEAAENAPSAFQRAAGLGVAGIETDIHATSDGICVISHDPTLDRTTDGRGRIAELPWSVVRRARIGGVEPVLRLEELLELVPGLIVNLDLKADSAVEPFLSAVRGSAELDRICVGSFSDRRLRQVRAALGPGLATSTGPVEVARLRLTGAGQRGPVAAQVPERFGPIPVVTRAFVRAAERSGMQVHVWTVDEPLAMQRLLGIGVAAIVTDRPAIAQAEVARFIGLG